MLDNVVVPVVEPLVTPEVVVVPPVVTAPVVEPVVTPPVVQTTDFYETASTTLTEAGFVPADVAAKIRDNGGKVSPELYAELSGKLGKVTTDLLAQGYEVKRADLVAKQEVENEKVYTEVGGKDAWEAISAWTQTDASGLSKEAADAYNEMLAAGGVKAALAAKALKEAYMASPGFTQEPNLVTGDSTPAPTGVVPISRAIYVAEKQKAIYANDSATIASLEARARFTQANHANIWRNVRISA